MDQPQNQKQKNHKLEVIKEETKRVRKEVWQKTLGYLTAALGLVAALAWNDAIRALINRIFPVEKNNLLAMFIYAAFVTFVVVMITYYLIRFTKREE